MEEYPAPPIPNSEFKVGDPVWLTQRQGEPRIPGHISYKRYRKDPKIGNMWAYQFEAVDGTQTGNWFAAFAFQAREGSPARHPAPPVSTRVQKDHVVVTQEFVDALALIAKEHPGNRLVAFLAGIKPGSVIVLTPPELTLLA